MTTKIIMVGYGGHARVLQDILDQDRNVEMIGYVDLEQKNNTSLRYLGTDDSIDPYSPHDIFLVNGIGSASSPVQRQEIYEKFKNKGYTFHSVVHPKALMASSVRLSEGVQMMGGVVINTGTKIGENTIINTSATIDQDCKIGAHCHIAPGVTLSGCVEVGATCHIGTGASIIQNIIIGDRSLIGAGAVVLKNIPSHVKAWGV